VNVLQCLHLFGNQEGENMGQSYIGILRNNPLFRGLTEEDIESVLNSAGARTRSAKAEEYILRVGEVTTEMGFVLKGSVLVIQEDFWGHRNIMSRVVSGDIFAEVFASAQGAPLNVSVVAHEGSEILFLDVNRLLSSTESRTERGVIVIRNLISALAKKTMAFNEKVTHISKRSTREKLLSYLSSQSLKSGSLSFDIAFNRQQLADYLCVERAAMSVELSKMQKEGILSYERNHFELKEEVEV